MYDEFDQEELGYAVCFRQETPQHRERVLMKEKRQQTGHEKRSTQARFSRERANGPVCSAHRRKRPVTCAA